MNFVYRYLPFAIFGWVLADAYPNNLGLAIFMTLGFVISVSVHDTLIERELRDRHLEIIKDKIKEFDV